MKFHRPYRPDMLSACDAVGPEDGIDPRRSRREPRRTAKNRKALQLCGQVAKTLHLVLSECADPMLRDLLVVSVVPAPDSTRLLVTVRHNSPSEQVQRAPVQEHLRRAYGMLRSEIAAAIHRKKVPELLFDVAVPEDANE
jgi:ribosome-binding factor A